MVEERGDDDVGGRKITTLKKRRVLLALVRPIEGILMAYLGWRDRRQ